MTRFGAGHRRLIPAAALIALLAPAEVSGQGVIPDVLGRAARVWPRSAESPIEGRVATVTESHLSLETEAPFCGPTGCVREYAVNWPDVDRFQVGRLSSTNRMVRAAALGAGLAALLGPGLASCGRDAGSARRCEATVVGLSAALGIGGFLFTRQSWEDVALPGSSR